MPPKFLSNLETSKKHSFSHCGGARLNKKENPCLSIQRSRDSRKVVTIFHNCAKHQSVEPAAWIMRSICIDESSAAALPEIRMPRS